MVEESYDMSTEAGQKLLQINREKLAEGYGPPRDIYHKILDRIIRIERGEDIIEAPYSRELRLRNENVAREITKRGKRPS